MLELWKARTLLERLGGSKGKHKSKNATDAHNLDSTKPANVEQEVEIGGFDMSFVDVVTHFNNKSLDGCDDWGVIRVRGVQAPVCKPLLSVGVYTSMGGVTALYGPRRFECCEEIRCMDPEGDERFTIAQLHSCVQREQRVQHLHETERKLD